MPLIMTEAFKFNAQPMPDPKSEAVRTLTQLFPDEINGLFVGSEPIWSEDEGGRYLGTEENPRLCLMSALCDGDEYSPPNGVRLIGPMALAGYGFRARRVSLGRSIEYLSPRALAHCPTLTEADISVGAKALPEGLLDGCYGLRLLRIGEGVREIGEDVIEGCLSLTELTLPTTLQSAKPWGVSLSHNIRLNSYNGGLYLGNGENPYFLLYATEVDFADTGAIHPECRIIGPEAFVGCCDKLRRLTVPSTVEHICPYALNFCEELRELSIAPLTVIHTPVLSEGAKFDLPTVTDPIG